MNCQPHFGVSMAFGCVFKHVLTSHILYIFFQSVTGIPEFQQILLCAYKLEGTFSSSQCSCSFQIHSFNCAHFIIDCLHQRVMIDKEAVMGQSMFSQHGWCSYKPCRPITSMALGNRNGYCVCFYHESQKHVTLRALSLQLFVCMVL